MLEIVILFSGEGTNLDVILQKIKNVNFHIITNKNKKKIKEISNINDKKIKSLSIINNNDELFKKLLLINPKLIVLSGYMKIIPKNIIEEFKIINLHPSLLPLNKGLNAIEKSFKDNNIYGGITFHWVNEKVDSGEIIYQEKINKTKLSFEGYLKKIKQMEHDNFYKIINKILMEK
jgi:phosphoribosylglycinamide formyltransferase-1